MGNLYAESGLKSNNLQDAYNKILKMTDEQYTEAVDKNTYKKFTSDGAGYGIAQWTYSSLKKELYDLCKSKSTSISDIDSQLECLYNQLNRKGLLDKIKNATSIEEASDIFLTQFEKPQDQSNSVKQKRIEYSQNYYNQFVGKVGKKMKYSKSNPPLVCMATLSPCYKQGTKMAVKGVLWHSTGANNKTLKRYIQPSPNDPNREELLAKIGKNPNNNSSNSVMTQIGLNAWVGTLADGSVATVQSMPWDYAPWGCGAGYKGSCNDGWIQFEICEDSLTDKAYFDAAYKEACELTAYLCQLYNLNPKGIVTYKGVQVPVITCHVEAGKLGLASNHSDVLHWFKRYNKTMDDVRNDVAKLLGTKEEVKKEEPKKDTNVIQLGDVNDNVKTLQLGLIKLGYSCGPDGADGDFGPNTLAAVKKFQKDQKIEVDGIVGVETLTALNKALNAQAAAKTLYRVRKTWSDAKSQIGAYTNLTNAKQACDKAGANYKVFDAAGKIVYQPTQKVEEPKKQEETKKEETPIKVVPAKTYSGVVLGSASHDENGAYRGGQAGDQTGTEVHTQNWYDCGWDTVLRPIDPVLAEKIAVADEGACGNANIGYDQNQRNTIYTQAKLVGLDLSKIKTPCECDCSSLVSTCCICAGLPEAYFFTGNMCTTWTLQAACQKTGKFQILKDSKYLRSKDYLKRGDILLNTNQHVVIVLSNGPKAESNEEYKPTTSNVPYIVKINTRKLNVRTGPGTNYPIKTYVYYNYKFTIVEEKEGWGRLKSGAGWIALEYTVKV